MSFRYYENWTAEQKAVIHKEDCGYCNYGKGCHENPLGDKNGRWSQSFETRQQVEDAARATGRPVKHCDCTDE